MRQNLIGRTLLESLYISTNIRGYVEYMLQSALLLGAEYSTQTKMDIGNILEFETKLAQFSQTDVFYEKVSFKKFNEMMDNSVDWLNITNTVYKELNETIRMKSDDLVIIQDINYYINVTQLLTTTPNRVIANYFGWKLIMNLGSHTTTQFRDISFKLNQLLTGVEKDVELWRSCTASISSQLPYVLSRVYVDQHFTQNDRQKKHRVNPKKSFEAMVYMQSNCVERNMRSIGQPVDITREQMARLNHRTFPATILKPPFLYSNGPATINYGAIGSTIGHELTHGFDGWDAKYNEKANCFVKQYSSEYVPEVHMN
ncbi:unnamed protein product, partial [Oppiella nova]